MERFTVEVQTPLQRLIVELALAKELEQAADAAPEGQVLDRCEWVALGPGREFLRQALTAALEQQAQAVEKKGRPADAAPAAPSAGTRAGRPAGS
ncbi:hypothetical protein [Tautonia rosea]|uniref:hypothetical protein n=1 Tax=Tautonia rosea TaxID=2728037 RepID=UPI0014748917|nr:hypothetical protein [Tautonia rosea]